MITIKYSISDVKEFQCGNLSLNAIKIDVPNTIDEMMKKAAPIAITLCIIMFVTMILKTTLNHTVVVHPLAIFIGFIIGFIMLPIHEWLHAIVYPRDAAVTIGKIKGKMIFVALASYPIKRKRFILMCLLPFILGIVPLLAFVFSPAEHRVFNGLMFGMACMGMVSPFPDVYNVISVLKYSKPNDKIMFYEDDIFRISN